MLTKQSDNKLIFDIGMHTGEDTRYYLWKGYRVVAVDADVHMINTAQKTFAEPIAKHQLILVNCAIADNEGTKEFYLSKQSLWNSLKPAVADRLSLAKETIEVPSRTLLSLLEEFGVPYYCKIDIEGYDLVGLKTLTSAKVLPPFISVESECLGEFETISDEEALATLNQLYQLGYRKFKLVEQNTLLSLCPKILFYRDSSNFLERKRKMVSIFRTLKGEYKFKVGASGPFGEEVDGNWLDYPTAKETLLFHRKSYFNLKISDAFSFWCDWHAKF